ncbi:hypothetical protein EV702DRAFT_1204111 [Suillus placidus]|uniref:Uncharacterized protein n=1 Tax=Suillus placidus TaxID=48579 RepID=A0A9P6ZHF8_9AGAM|nr:hypothetical protein EV702DRAFT_1204111 [Suillus placidus]
MWLGQNVVTDNLNIIVPNSDAVGLGLYAFIIDDLGYRNVDANVPINHVFEGVVESFTKFQRDNVFITVTEATPHGIFRVITSAPTTADMVVMTAGGLAVFYSAWTLYGIALTNHTVISSVHSQNIGCRKDMRWNIQINTNFMGKPCDDFCPTLWHNVADHGREILVTEWDTRFSLKVLLKRSKTMWRLSRDCQNSMCMHNSNINVHKIDLPANPMPQDYENIRNQESLIQNHQPTYLGQQCGVLYATNARDAHVVTVPWRDGVSNLNHNSHLKVLHWADQLGPDLFTTSFAQFQKTYNELVENGHPASQHGYTFFREHPKSYSPPNALIRKLARITRNDMDVTSNVLVIKHVRGNKHAVVNCMTEDITYINNIMKRAIGRNEFWT